MGENSRDFFPCQLGELDLLGREFRQRFLLIQSRCRLNAVRNRLTELAPRLSSWWTSPESRPIRAVISAASKDGTIPSWSVVQTVRPIRVNEAWRSSRHRSQAYRRARHQRTKSTEPQDISRSGRGRAVTHEHLLGNPKTSKDRDLDPVQDQIEADRRRKFTRYNRYG